jgi:hypothetical protein
MNLRRESRMAFGVILAVQLIAAFGAILLLTRMGPAVSRVSRDNVASLNSVERMLAVLAQGELIGESGKSEFRTALERAAENITEPQEPALVESVSKRMEAALEGDSTARLAVIVDLQRLGDVNRAAMARADAEGHRLATAGAWAEAILAVIAFLLVRFVADRADRLVVMPILEIFLTLDSAREGDVYRRCAPLRASAEVNGIADGVNDLLDGRFGTKAV